MIASTKNMEYEKINDNQASQLLFGFLFSNGIVVE